MINKTVNKRFAKVFEDLKKQRLVKNKTDIARIMETYNHVINSIMKNERGVTVEQIRLLCSRFDVNANYIIGTSMQMYKTEDVLQYDQQARLQKSLKRDILKLIEKY